MRAVGPSARPTLAFSVGRYSFVLADVEYGVKDVVKASTSGGATGKNVGTRSTDLRTHRREEV